jgi:hypothetical protein
MVQTMNTFHNDGYANAKSLISLSIVWCAWLRAACRLGRYAFSQLGPVHTGAGAYEGVGARIQISQWNLAFKKIL